MTVFADRDEAGRLLAEALRERLSAEAARVVVLAIPRGGVPVGARVAQALDAPLDVVVVRKLRAPEQPELGYGAVGADGHVHVDHELVRRLGLTERDIAREVEDRLAVVRRRVDECRALLPAPDLDGATAVVVDDGVATGGTAREACALARRSGAAAVMLAVPVGPADARRSFRDVADDVVVLEQPVHFRAVGQVYLDFTQLDDATVESILRRVADTRA